MIAGNFLVHEVVFWAANFVMWIVYKASIPFFEQYKANSYAWPWNGDWSPSLYKVLALVIFNITILSPIVLSFEVMAAGKVQFEFALEAYPTSLEVLWQLAFFVLVEDVSFYWAHRLLHTKWLYGKIHKIHHENRLVYGIASEYAHPIEYVLGNGIPSALGAKLLGRRVHIVTFWLWIVLRITETVDGHSGYDFPWSPFRVLPMSTNGRYHDYHHAENIGCYGSFFTIWDTVFGTNTRYYTSIEGKRAKVK